MGEFVHKTLVKMGANTYIPHILEHYSSNLTYKYAQTYSKSILLEIILKKKKKCSYKKGILMYEIVTEGIVFVVSIMS